MGSLHLEWAAAQDHSRLSSSNGPRMDQRFQLIFQATIVMRTNEPKLYWHLGGDTSVHTTPAHTNYAGGYLQICIERAVRTDP